MDAAHIHLHKKPVVSDEGIAINNGNTGSMHLFSDFAF